MGILGRGRRDEEPVDPPAPDDLPVLYPLTDEGVDLFDGIEAAINKEPDLEMATSLEWYCSGISVQDMDDPTDTAEIGGVELVWKLRPRHSADDLTRSIFVQWAAIPKVVEALMKAFSHAVKQHMVDGRFVEPTAPEGPEDVL